MVTANLTVCKKASRWLVITSDPAVPPTVTNSPDCRSASLGPVVSILSLPIRIWSRCSETSNKSIKACSIFFHFQIVHYGFNIKYILTGQSSPSILAQFRKTSSSSVRGSLPSSGKFLWGYVYVLSSPDWPFLFKMRCRQAWLLIIMSVWAYILLSAFKVPIKIIPFLEIN